MINQTRSVFTRVNGRGNAWPVFLGSTHPFYDTNDIRDLANASYSIIGMETEDYSTDFISLWQSLDRSLDEGIVIKDLRESLNALAIRAFYGARVNRSCNTLLQ